jgi:IS5 family transposase
VTDTAKFEGAMLRDGLLDKTDTASSVWADSAYRSKANETFLAANGFTSKIHRKKPQGGPMPKRTARANARKSAVRGHVEHVFAEQKYRMALCVRTIGLSRPELKIGMANLVYNIRRTLWLDRRASPASRPKPGKTDPKTGSNGQN